MWSKPSAIGKNRCNPFLSLKGVAIFNPLMETFSLGIGRESKELKPLLSTYLFGKFDVEQDYPLVRRARGVKKILSFGGYPTPISEPVVKLIKRRTDPNGIDRTSLSLMADDPVRIDLGPPKDLVGIFERWVSDGERVRILLNVIGYQPTVELHFAMIKKVA